MAEVEIDAKLSLYLTNQLNELDATLA